MPENTSNKTQSSASGSLEESQKEASSLVPSQPLDHEGVSTISDGYMVTLSGIQVNIEEPRPEQFHIRDIAHGLSLACRYAGQIPSFYSVAQHSVLVSAYVPSELRLAGLLHDAAEAYLGDVIAPLKQFLPEYRRIEENMLYVIFNAMSVPWPNDLEWEEIKHSDHNVLMAEVEDLMLPNQYKDVSFPFEYVPVERHYKISAMQPVDAERLFMASWGRK